MAELYKVIKALELCCYRDETFRNPLEHGFNCANCPYFSECDKIHSFCGDKLKKDALELLKEQAERLDKYREALLEEQQKIIRCRDCKHYDIDFCKLRRHESSPDFSCLAGEVSK